MRAEEETLTWNELERLLNRLELACNQIDLNEIRALLMQAVDGFDPKSDVIDPQWDATDVEQPIKKRPKITPLFRD